MGDHFTMYCLAAAAIFFGFLWAWSEFNSESRLRKQVRKELGRLLPPCENCGSPPYELDPSQSLSEENPHQGPEENSR